MQSQQLDNLRAGSATCPSDLLLDRLHAGELSGSAAREIEAHVAGCTLCPQRMAERRAGFDAFADLDARPLLAGIHRRLDAEKQQKASRFSLAKLFAILAPATALTAVMVFAMLGRTPQVGGPELDTIREKGGSVLHVFRQTGESVKESLSGDEFYPGDHLRFVVDVKQRGRLAVLGVEASGVLYVAWPQGEGISTLREAGPQQQLPGAVVLDENVGRELLYLVSCPESVGTPSSLCKSTGAVTPPSCPAGCSQSVFVLNKKPK
jgi:hypothetical protein